MGDDYAQSYSTCCNRVRASRPMHHACTKHFTSLNFQKIEHEYKEQKSDGAVRDPQSGLPTGKRMHKPLAVTTSVGSASPALTTQNKPLTTTVNPALQGNVLQNGTVGGSTGPTKPTLPTTGGQRQ